MRKIAKGHCKPLAPPLLINELLLLHSQWVESRGQVGARLVAIGTNLAGADMRRSDLRYAVFTGSDLSDSDLRESNVYGAAFHATNLAGAKLTGAHGLTLRQFGRSNLNGAHIDATVNMGSASLKDKSEACRTISMASLLVAAYSW